MITPCELAALCRLIAPELGTLYVVLTSSVPALGEARAVRGLTTVWLDLTLQAHLDWRGRGPCIVLNDRLVAAEGREYGGAVGLGEPEAIAWTFRATCLHELSHVVARGSPFYQQRLECLP